ncbi:Carboxynorspermidine decarboxylase [Desulfamplus magnetovallimortis]|uniref:Carboxynorspermidine/carboxyspermidine decarboxylase n=1 Tax=Desulfamplus magnetovallimortis TaxID=1246637 RepID=A0A1W1HHC5_9BACT|nr:carboxynorspermidine decarboxylase [Desulfamplus magnetovallimortis]SLM31778.1 Carboxynorspermidine decarboxylase [Desulfamplus magnetovallimortis]
MTQSVNHEAIDSPYEKIIEMLNFNPEKVVSPCFVVDENLLAQNLETLSHVRSQTNCKILLALKCFAMFRVFPLVRSYLDGICASSPHEARLGRENFNKEVHTFAAAYSESDIVDLCNTSDHLIFNSFDQMERFKPIIDKSNSASGRMIEIGIRINPEHSEGALPIYDPCAPGSRLGVRRINFREDLVHDISGLHWHNLCEQDADCLERTIKAVEKGFGDLIGKMKYVNFGGGHHITRPGYNMKLLITTIQKFRQKWGVEVYLEPGEAVALNAGFLVVTILDIIKGSDMDIAIMDACVPAHMPDVMEAPYRPYIMGSGKQGEKRYTCRIGGLSCLAGDIAGVYSFDEPLKVGDRLVFTDMAIYSMVKTNTFNGVKLPDIALVPHGKKCVEMVRQFSYDDFKSRLS